MSFYRPLLKRTLILTLKNKWLWFLGFFAAFIGNGGVYEALLRSFNNLSDERSVFYTLKEYSQTGVLGMMSWSNLKNLWVTDPSALGVGVFTLLIFLIAIALLISFGVIGQAGVVRGVVDLDQGKKSSLKKNFRTGVDRFWPVLEVNFITKIVLFGILLLIAYLVSLVTLQSEFWSLFMYVVSFIVFIILGIIIYFLTVYGTAYAVLRNKDAFTSLKYAWQLFRKHVLLNLEMGLILFIINVVLAIAFFIAGFILLAPFILLYFLFLLSGAQTAMFIMFTLIILIFLVFMVLVGSWFAAFQLGAWAVLFEELEIKGAKSKILRMYEGFSARVSPRRRKK
jgi:hypothetical protein